MLGGWEKRAGPDRNEVKAMPWKLDWVPGGPRQIAGFRMHWINASEKENDVTMVLVTNDAWDTLGILVKEREDVYDHKLPNQE
jgi:hypothetical protein